MIKKIPIDQIQPGMYVHDLNCNWIDHPFLLNRFKVTDRKQIAQVRRLGLRELYIDTERGLDVADAPSEPEVIRGLNAGLKQVAERAPTEQQKTSLREEMEQAGMTLNNVGGAAIESWIADLYKADPDVVERARALTQ